MTTIDDDLHTDKEDDAISIANEKVRAANRKAILKNPRCIFRKRRGNFPNPDEIKLAFGLHAPPLQDGERAKWLRDYDWRTLVALARNAQEETLRRRGCSADSIATFLKTGWAWDRNGILVIAREDTWKAKQVPNEEGKAFSILFRRDDHGWVPPDPLITLAGLKLGVESETEQKNHGGRGGNRFEVALGHVEKWAAFYGESPSEYVKGRAIELRRQCAELHWMLNNQPDAFAVAEVAREIGKAEVMLRIFAEDEMLKEISSTASFVGTGEWRKGDGTPEIERAWLDLARKIHGRPSVPDLMKKLDAKTSREKSVKMIRIHSEDIIYSAFLKRVDRIAHKHSELWKITPDATSKRGRPRKHSVK